MFYDIVIFITLILTILLNTPYDIMNICTDMKLRSRNFSIFMIFPSEQGKYRIKMISNAFPLSAVRKTIKYAYKNNKKEKRCFLVVKTTNVS